ncbi:MAG: type II secretion system protein, partial [Steroidobacteraceae bacterium]
MTKQRYPVQIDRQRGFTLLEILIAVAIFTIVGAMAMGGYN